MFQLYGTAGSKRYSGKQVQHIAHASSSTSATADDGARLCSRKNKNSLDFKRESLVGPLAHNVVMPHYSNVVQQRSSLSGVSRRQGPGRRIRRTQRRGASGGIEVVDCALLDPLKNRKCQSLMQVQHTRTVQTSFFIHANFEHESLSFFRHYRTQGRALHQA